MKKAEEQVISAFVGRGYSYFFGGGFLLASSLFFVVYSFTDSYWFFVPSGVCAVMWYVNTTKGLSYL